MAINSDVLAEMEMLEVYLESLPKIKVITKLGHHFDFFIMLHVADIICFSLRTLLKYRWFYKVQLTIVTVYVFLYGHLCLALSELKKGYQHKGYTFIITPFRLLLPHSL
ncbi:hypothetical protein GUJ93_ZPchr0010g10642 [Zizania palustris]|uniref:PRONE domain-containing protein n=1 Tax=Zizania palustris TaxID=103762 RepID=A0A8J5W7D2_ZIZPA|nr:hypothetical protein GUJ93_ZPchr0010g10642 [Zizania palustris]